MADPGFSPGGAPTPKSAIIFQIFCWKLHKSERIWIRRDVPGTPTLIRQCSSFLLVHKVTLWQWQNEVSNSCRKTIVVYMAHKALRVTWWYWGYHWKSTEVGINLIAFSDLHCKYVISESLLLQNSALLISRGDDRGYCCSGGSRISPRRGRQLSRGVPTYDFAKFSQKLHEIERI